MLYLVAIGSVPEKALEWIENAAAEWFPLPLRRLPPLSLPESAYDRKRGQYQSVEIMKMLAQNAPPDATRLLGVTDVDLSIPMLSFLFGQAQLDGPIAVVSLCRLHQEFYGLPAGGEPAARAHRQGSAARVGTHLRTCALFRAKVCHEPRHPHRVGRWQRRTILCALRHALGPEVYFERGV